MGRRDVDGGMLGGGRRDVGGGMWTEGCGRRDVGGGGREGDRDGKEGCGRRMRDVCGKVLITDLVSFVGS